MREIGSHARIIRFLAETTLLDVGRGKEAISAVFVTHWYKTSTQYESRLRRVKNARFAYIIHSRFVSNIQKRLLLLPVFTNPFHSSCDMRFGGCVRLSVFEFVCVARLVFKSAWLTIEYINIVDIENLKVFFYVWSFFVNYHSIRSF